MPREIVNPFQNLDLRVPKSEWDAVRRFTGTFRPEDGSEPDIDRSPFRRYVDLWWAAMCIGVREGRRTKLPADAWHPFITGVILSSDPWRIFHLEMLAIAEAKDAEILKNPSDIITMANEYAAAGFPRFTEAMLGKSEPIWSVSQFLKEQVLTPSAPTS
jgi:hypothetical protein